MLRFTFHLWLATSLLILAFLIRGRGINASAGSPPVESFSSAHYTSNPTLTPSPRAFTQFESALEENSTETIKPTETGTSTPTATATDINTPVETATPTIDPIPSPTEQQTLDLKYRLSLPLLWNGFSDSIPVLPDRHRICAAPKVLIPDSDAQGIDLTLLSLDQRPIADLDVFLDIDHSHVGDLAVSLTHVSSGRSALLIDRPGQPEAPTGCPNNDIIAVLDDEMELTVESRCEENGLDPAGRMIPAITGGYKPTQALETFDGMSAGGEWVLNVADLAAEDTGIINQWCLEPVYGDLLPAPPVSPPGILPDSARIYNIKGVDQSMPLSCESRSAVDFAAYFGKTLSEYKFFNALPGSDNPDAGFVGSVWGTWGQIPPYDYGVHAEPVARQLRSYGVSAYAHRPLGWDQLRWEIFQNRPVIVWVVDSIGFLSPPVFYTSSDGHNALVARYEHTVMVIGYTPTSVTILDGASIYTRSLDNFLSNWSIMGNMAITGSQG